MARIDVKNNFSFNLANLDLNSIYEAYNYVASGTVFQAQYGGGSSDTFRGIGFTYNALGEPTGGIVTSYQSMLYGRVAFTISNVAAAASSLVSVAHTASNSDDRALMVSYLSAGDAFFGSGGYDLFAGYGGNDTISGGAGDDRLNGGAGNDLIIGGRGADALTGGTGGDVFRYSWFSETSDDYFGHDTIRDFRRGSDKIDLKRIDANTTVGGNQAFKWIGGNAFDGHAGELRFEGGFIYGDVNGDGIADFSIRVAGLSKMAASDFVL